MKRQADHDKTQNESSADSRRSLQPEEDFSPDYADIAARAHAIWLAQGQPANSAEENWLEAERELRASAMSRRLVEEVNEHGGSVQR